MNELVREWLTARPVAHRGLHDARAGIVENTPSAFAAAIAQNYAIECDIQVASDGEAMVYHDDALGRLTHGVDRLDTMTSAALKRAEFRNTADRMMTLRELCDLVSGKVPLLIEIKSRFDGNPRLTERASHTLSDYSGPAALMSFDAAPIAMVRTLAPRLPRGIVGERHVPHAERSTSPAQTKRALNYLRNLLSGRPQFLAYSVDDLTSPVPWIARNVLRLPLLTWTVRTDADRARATRYADQMIFEGFRP